MKHIQFLLMALLNLISLAALASQVTLSWDASTQSVLGYKIYYGTSPGSYTASLNVGNVTTATVTGLASGTTYYFAVTDYDSTQESPVSNQVSATTPTVTPPPPTTGGESLLSSLTPAGLSNSDGAGVNYELGMKFYSISAGQITAIKFYKSPSESGTHTGKIYSASGALLASVVFSSESSSGWQSQNLSTPLSIAANTNYVVSVNSGNTYYVDTVNGLASQISSTNLRTVVGSNGVYGSVGAMPTNSWNNSNYFRDIVFTASSVQPPPPTADTQAPMASITSPVNGASVTHNTTVSIAASASDNVGVTKVEFYVNGSLKCTDSSSPYTCAWLVPKRTGRTYQLQVKAYDAAGNVGSSSVVKVTSK